MPATVARHAFPPRARLLRPADFQRVYAVRERISDSFFSVNFIANDVGHPRLGLSIAGKVVGNSVARNRVKRQVRESFRQAAGTIPAIDVVVGARAGARSAHNARLRESLADLWKRLNRLCAAPSAP
jgi:ribonuclease P protein component